MTTELETALIVERLRCNATLAYGDNLAYYGEVMEDAADEIERLRAALRDADCPYPVIDDRSVGACVDGGHCGCSVGEPLQQMPIKGNPTDDEK